jgi:uncharacterized protein (DUF2236 family)
VAQGIADHSAFRSRRHGRVRRLFGTVDAMLQLSFGTEPGELGRYMDAMLSSGAITITDNARMLARDSLYPPAPRLAAPVVSLVRLQTVGLLPPEIREDYGLPWSARRETLLSMSTGFARMMLRVTPPIVRHWPAARRAHRRTVR